MKDLALGAIEEVGGRHRYELSGSWPVSKPFRRKTEAAYAVLATAASLSLISVSTSMVKVYGGQSMSRLLSVG